MRHLSCLALLMGGSAAAGQEPPPQSIVVTGRGLRPAIGEQVYTSHRIDRERLANAPSSRLEDVLRREVPGFQQFRRSDARSANPTSQGATLRALGGNASSRALLILDGVPQADPFGGWISWPGFDPRRLGEVRVVRGGGTGAAGPGALAGTIELESATVDELGGNSARLAYGSRDSLDLFAATGTALGSGFLTVTGSWADGDGFIPVVAGQRGPVDRPSPYRQASLALRGVAPVRPNLELQANLSAFIDRRERGTPLSDIRTTGADGSLRLVGSGPLPFSAVAYVQSRDFSNLFAAANADRTAVAQTLDQHSVPATGLGARAELRPRLGAVELRLGGDWREVEGRTHELFQFVGGAPLRGRVAGGRTRTLGGFAELAWQTGRWTLAGGGRLDRWWIEDGQLVERLLADGSSITTTAFPDRAGWEPTGRFGLAWQPSEQLLLRAAGYRGWRLPTLNELYRPFRTGLDATAANAGLSPERLDGAEAGLELRPSAGARAAVTLFVNRLEDAIANVTLAEGPGQFPGVGFVAAGGEFRHRQNVEAVRSRGIELDAELARGPWRLGLGYSFADAELRAAGAAAPLDGLRPAQAPRHAATASISWRDARGVYATIGAQYVGSQYEDDLNRQRLGDALVLDGLVALPLTDRLAIELRGENLADARVVAGISGAGIVERATPRTIWLGLRWTN